MKKIVLVLIITGLVLPLFSATWSATVDADANVYGKTDALIFDNVDRFTLQAFVPFGETIPMSISAETFYEFTFSKPLQGVEESSMLHLVDVAELVFTTQFPVGESNRMTINAGRFDVYDMTGLILAQQMDGAKVVYRAPKYELSMHAGFTGFLNGHTQTMYGVVNQNILSEVYTLAPAFVLANITFRLPYLFDAQHAFTAEVNGAIEATDNESKSNRIYATAGLQGPLGEIFYYNVSSTLSLIMLEENTFGNISVLELSAFLPFAESILSWKTVFSTGGTENSFIPISEIMASMDSSIPYVGKLKTGLLGIIHPVDSVFLLLSSDVIFNISDASQDTGYMGVQWGFSTRWDIASDVQLIGSVGNFFSSDSTTEPYLDASLALSITF